MCSEVYLRALCTIWSICFRRTGDSCAEAWKRENSVSDSPWESGWDNSCLCEHAALLTDKGAGTILTGAPAIAFFDGRVFELGAGTF